MSPVMVFLAFMLHLLTAATQALNATDLHSLFPSNSVNDVLNITRCYCHGDLDTDERPFGYYVRETLPLCYPHIRSFALEHTVGLSTWLTVIPNSTFSSIGTTIPPTLTQSQRMAGGLTIVKTLPSL